MFFDAIVKAGPTSKYLINLSAVLYIGRQVNAFRIPFDDFIRAANTQKTVLIKSGINKI